MIDRARGVAYLSTDDRREPSERGALYAYDLGAAERRPVDVTPELGFPFHPHGLGLWSGPDGERRLFVVNHGGGEETVEIFAAEGDGLRHLERVRESGGLLHSGNDVAPVGPRSFYLTNFHGARSRGGRLAELLGLRARSTLLHYDGARWTRAAGAIALANGVAVTADGRWLFVAATRSGVIRPYRREGDVGGSARQRWCWTTMAAASPPPAPPRHGAVLLIGSVYGGFLHCELGEGA